MDAFGVIRYLPLVLLLLGMGTPPRGVRGQRQRGANGAKALWGGRWELGWRAARMPWQMNTKHIQIREANALLNWK